MDLCSWCKHRGGGPVYPPADLCMGVGMQLKIDLEDYYERGRGGIQSKTLIGVAPGHL